MGNTPAKEVRPASSTYNGAHKSEHDLFLSDIEDIGLAGLSRKKKEKERERRKRREEHLLNLIVRYEENVDGGYLAPYGNYKYNLSYKTQVVRDLIIERQLAPFYTPLEDYDSRWPDRQLLAHIHLMNLHATCTPEDRSTRYITKLQKLNFKDVPVVTVRYGFYIYFYFAIR